MRYIICSIFMISTLIKMSNAVRCDTNPCQLGIDYIAPNYQCIQAVDDLDNVICTCPDGHVEINKPCRICDSINCGQNGFCVEKSFYENFFYVCACANGTYNYLNPGPCSDVNQITTPLPDICLNGGTYDAVTSTCICLSGFTGSLCETTISSSTCQNVVCANGGVCNPTSIVENGTETQCSCSEGFFGANCEIIGTPGRCVPNQCQNSGICEEETSGTTTYSYCRCASGFNGQCCETQYFSCPVPGVYADPVNCKYGRYFQCGVSTLSTSTCPIGLRYNFMKMRCDSDVSCPP